MNQVQSQDVSSLDNSRVKTACLTNLMMKYNKELDSYVFSVKPIVTFQAGPAEEKEFRRPDSPTSEMMLNTCRSQLHKLFSSEEDDHYEIAVLTGRLDHLRHTLDSACTDALIGLDLSHLWDKKYINVAQGERFELELMTHQERKDIHEEHVSEEAKRAIGLLLPDTTFDGEVISPSSRCKKQLLQKMVDEMEEERPFGTTTATWSHVLSKATQTAFKEMEAKDESLKAIFECFPTPVSSTTVESEVEENGDLITKVTFTIKRQDGSSSSTQEADTEDEPSDLSFKVTV